MLDIAIKYKDQLNSKIRNIYFNDKYKYWFADSYCYINDINYDTICYADKHLINSLLNRFGDCSSTYLTQLSINQKPWINAYVKNGHKIISTDSIKNYFKNNNDTNENCQGETMRYTIELDNYELKTLKNIVKKAYKEAKKGCEGKTGFDRDVLEDSAFKLLLLAGKLDNIIVMGDKI